MKIFTPRGPRVKNFKKLMTDLCSATRKPPERIFKKKNFLGPQFSRIAETEMQID